MLSSSLIIYDPGRRLMDRIAGQGRVTKCIGVVRLFDAHHRLDHTSDPKKAMFQVHNKKNVRLSYVEYCIELAQNFEIKENNCNF